MATCLIRASRFLLSVGLIVSSAWVAGEAHAQAVVDEARQAGRAAQTFPAADEDYFKNMDGGVTLTADEVKARIKKRGDKIARLQEELTHLKDYLVRHHRDQIGDALTEAEAIEISERIDAEATARPANTTKAIARLTPWIEERRA